jgi:50S ribosomal protein uL3
MARRQPSTTYAILGKKIGMTQIFNENGDVVPVTVVAAGPCKVLQKKTPDTDGYYAVQLGFDDKKKSRVNKPEAGHFAKSSSPVKRYVEELRLDEKTIDLYDLGQELNASNFQVGDVSTFLAFRLVKVSKVFLSAITSAVKFQLTERTSFSVTVVRLV